MYRFFECKYSFKVTFLLRKLEFYTRVHKKINYKSITVCIKIKKWEATLHCKCFQRMNKTN